MLQFSSSTLQTFSNSPHSYKFAVCRLGEFQRWETLNSADIVTDRCRDPLLLRRGHLYFVLLLPCRHQVVLIWIGKDLGRVPEPGDYVCQSNMRAKFVYQWVLPRAGRMLFRAPWCYPRSLGRCQYSSEQLWQISQGLKAIGHCFPAHSMSWCNTCRCMHTTFCAVYLSEQCNHHFPDLAQMWGGADVASAKAHSWVLKRCSAAFWMTERVWLILAHWVVTLSSLVSRQRVAFCISACKPRICQDPLKPLTQSQQFMQQSTCRVMRWAIQQSLERPGGGSIETERSCFDLRHLFKPLLKSWMSQPTRKLRTSFEISWDSFLLNTALCLCARIPRRFKIELWLLVCCGPTSKMPIDMLCWGFTCFRDPI